MAYTEAEVPCLWHNHIFHLMVLIDARRNRTEKAHGVDFLQSCRDFVASGELFISIAAIVLSKQFGVLFPAGSSIQCRENKEVVLIFLILQYFLVLRHFLIVTLPHCDTSSSCNNSSIGALDSLSSLNSNKSHRQYGHVECFSSNIQFDKHDHPMMCPHTVFTLTCSASYSSLQIEQSSSTSSFSSFDFLLYFRL